MRPRLSLCICTMNRPSELRECLRSVTDSSEPPHEVIVSDDSNEATAPEVATVVKGFSGVRYTPGPRRGLSANRNHCLDEASGDVVVFIDDDVKLHPEFLARGRAAFERVRGRLGTERIILTGSEIRPDGQYDPSPLSFLGFYTGRLAEGQTPKAICINSTLFSAKLFEQARFDEKIFFGSEERDISFHALHLGYQIVYCPELLNYHFPSSVNRDIYSRVQTASRFYFGLKRYWLYERSVARFVLFNLYAPANAIGNRLKRFRLRESMLALRAFLTAWKLFRAQLRN